MSDALRRAFDFLARGDMGGPHAERTRFGTLHADPRFPLRWDSNYHLVDRLALDVSADELEADVERAQAAAGFAHRCIFLRDEETADRLAPTFVAHGWSVQRFVVMAHRRPPEKAVDTAIVREVDESMLRRVRERNIPAWGTPEVRAQLLDAKLGIAERVTVRFFAVVVDGEAVSYTDLYQDGDVAQVEDVATLDPWQGRGYASAVVTKAVEEARAAEAKLVFLVADADDWPRALYGRLGFDEMGRYVKFQRSATSES